MMTATMPSLHGIAPGAQNEPVKSILDTDLYVSSMVVFKARLLIIEPLFGRN